MKVREPMAAGLACLGIVLAAIAAAAWTAISGQIVRQGVDALFLILVCLLVAAVFAPAALQALREFRRGKGGGGQ